MPSASPITQSVANAGGGRSCLLPAAAVRRLAKLVATAAFPMLPHFLLEFSAPLAAALATVCYVLLVRLIVGPERLSIVIVVGALHGALLALVAAWWLWTFARSPAALPLIAAAVLAAYYALACALARAIARRVGATAGLTLVAGVLCLAELGRGFVPDAFMPLGTLALALAAPPFLALAGVVSSAGLSLFGFLINGAVAGIAPPTRRSAAIILAAAAIAVLASNFHRPAAAAPLALRTLCAYSDSARRNKPDGLYAPPAWLAARVGVAADAGCSLVAFPELTAAIATAQSQESSTPALPLVILGVRRADSIEAERAILGIGSTNSVCLAAIDMRRVSCINRVDKRFLIPLIEANLFQTVPGLRRFGAILTTLIMGAENPTTTLSRATVLPAGAARIGILNCAELFLPLVIQRDADGQQVRPALVVAVTDYSGFPPLPTLRAAARQAARLQAVAAGAPLLLVSTEDAALFLSSGAEAPPRFRNGDFYLWLP